MPSSDRGNPRGLTRSLVIDVAMPWIAVQLLQTERQAVNGALRDLCGFVDRLIAEDEPVLNTMRFRKGVLVASDRHLARHFKYVSEFPRGAPPSE